MKSLLAVVSAVTMLLLAVEAQAAFGRVKDDDPYALRVVELERKVEEMERVLENQSLLELFNELEAAKEEIRNLRAMNEELQHEVNGLKERQKELYLDMDRRMRALELGGASGGAVANGTDQADAGGTTTPTNGNADREAYDEAFALLKDARYEQAKVGFARMLQAHPDSKLAANARYWLGEANYVTRNFADAITEFNRVLQDYPDSNKVPDSLLKIGYCFYELKDWANARRALRLAVERHPGHQAAEQAAIRLDRIDSEGH